MRTTPLSLALLALFATTSYAEPPRYSRKQTFAVEVTLSTRVKPTVPVAKPHAPALTADEIVRVEDDNEPIRREQEALLQKLVRDTPDDDPEKPDHMFRLAEHYAKELRHWRIKANEPARARQRRR
jgi:hypothetical protein